MSTIRDAWLRKFATQLPLGIDIKDDDGNVIHSSIGDPKTHKITLYSAWLGKSSGGSTGGNTGGTTTNPGHETVGDDVYPGDVNKGEVTKRFKLWQGPSNTNADTTVTFNQDLGENLDGLGDGLQAQMSMIETQYIDGKPAGSRKVKISSDVDDNWSYLTDIPVPISFKKGRLASKDILSVKANLKNKEFIYASKFIDIPPFKTPEEYPGTVGVFDISAGILNSSGEIDPRIVSDTSFELSATNPQVRTPYPRAGARMVVSYDGKNIAHGMIGGITVHADGIPSLTAFASGDFKLHYEDIEGNIVSNEVNIASFTTLKKYDESNTVFQVPTSSTPYVPTVNSFSNGFGSGYMLRSSEPKDRKIAILDRDNNLVSLTPNIMKAYVDGLDPDTVYSGYKLAVVNSRTIKDTDVVTSPSISFQIGVDGNMNLKPVQGVVKDSAGAIIATYDIVIDYVNSYTSQKEVPQISSQEILFHGSAKEAKLAGVSKDFDNVQDGLVINLVNPIVWSSPVSGIIRTAFSDLMVPKKIKISKSKIFSGVTNIDYSNEFETYLNHGINYMTQYKDGTWVDLSMLYTINSASVSLSIQNGSVELKAYLYMNATSSGQSAAPMPLQIASVTTYKEDE